jgi:hypothetical protein
MTETKTKINKHTSNKKQDTILQAITDNKHNFIMAPRQCGMTSLLACYIIDKCFNTIDHEAVYITDTVQNARHVGTILQDWLDALPHGIVRRAIQRNDKQFIRFANGSSITVTNEREILIDGKLRGRSIHSAIIDNASYFVNLGSVYEGLMTRMAVQSSNKMTIATTIEPYHQNTSFFWRDLWVKTASGKSTFKLTSLG